MITLSRRHRQFDSHLRLERALNTVLTATDSILTSTTTVLPTAHTILTNTNSTLITADTVLTAVNTLLTDTELGA
jgi:hypothetical protein